MADGLLIDDLNQNISGTKQHLKKVKNSFWHKFNKVKQTEICKYHVVQQA
jgi:hypothetical protein